MEGWRGAGLILTDPKTETVALRFQRTIMNILWALFMVEIIVKILGEHR